MSEVQRQLLITLVHGTWGRGFFPRRQKQRALWYRLLMTLVLWRRQAKYRSPFWFEEDSQFLARLCAELHDVPHKIAPLPWTGENSIDVRDETAHALAEQLSAEHAEHPQATQLVIAHSHGGNIALRALHHLKQRDASRPRAEPLVVTLATPFVEVHHADLGFFRPFFFRGAMVVIILSVAWAGLSYVLSFLPALPVPFGKRLTFAIGVLGGFLAWRWLRKKKPARQSKLDALKDATQIGDLTPVDRLLVVRAIDDEASLTMALGTIFSYATVTSIACVYAVFFGVLEISLLIEQLWSPWLVELARPAYAAIMFSLMVLFIMFMVSRTVHGRELARSPIECQINTQSTPDAVSLSKIITLVQRKYVKSLRHGIYDHEDCAKTISDWVRSQLVR